MDPRGFPTSLPEFQRVFPDDEACAGYLEALRWPGGFTCPSCGVRGEPYRFPTRSSVVLRCRACKKSASLTAGTTMQSSHTALSTWFWGAYLMTTQTPGQSALQFQRQLGLSRYETAFQMLHKLRAGMVRPARDTIGGKWPVEVDECVVGGRILGQGGGPHLREKAIVIGAIEVRNGGRSGQTKKRRHLSDKHAGRLRLAVIPNRLPASLIGFVCANVTKGSIVRTDGWHGYCGLTNRRYDHVPVTAGRDVEVFATHLPMIHLVFSNLKAWIDGTHHGVSRRHLQAYLNEFVFRFNRRFYPMTAFNSVLGLAAHTVPPTYDDLYSGEWRHPTG